MKIIIGLGNPGNKFLYTRHNIGKRVVDFLAHKFKSNSWSTVKNYEYIDACYNNQLIKLIKPLTYMNNSGDIFKTFNTNNIQSSNILVVHDELELPFGKLKIKYGGSAKGHNGLRSIIQIIGKDFYRLSFGIGRPANKDISTYVLSDFLHEQEHVISDLLEESYHLINQHFLSS